MTLIRESELFALDGGSEGKSDGTGAFIDRSEEKTDGQRNSIGCRDVGSTAVALFVVRNASEFIVAQHRIVYK